MNNNIMDIGSMYGIEKKYNIKKSMPRKSTNHKQREMIINNNVPYLLRDEGEVHSDNFSNQQNNIGICTQRNTPSISQAFIKENMLGCHNYDTNREIIWKNMNGYLSTQTGRMAELEFFIGNERKTKTGYITFVGENYIIINNHDLGESTLCCCDDIKFITFYD